MTVHIKSDAQIITCQECGEKCARVEFIRGLNVCDHLALDSIALKAEEEQANIF